MAWRMSHSRNAGALIRAMLSLRTERRTGVLRVDADGVRTFVYVMKGTPVFAEEGTLGETLGRLLVRQRVLTQEQYVQVIERMTLGVAKNEQARFGEVAVELGFLTAEQVRRALADQVRWKVIRAFQREEPEWTFTDSEGELESVGHFFLPIESLVLDAARWFSDEQKQELVLAREMARFPSVRGDPTLLAERFEMTMEEMRFVAGLDGTRTLADVLDAPAPGGAGKGVDVAALLTALVLVGAVELATVKKDPRIRQIRSLLPGAISRASPLALDALSQPSRGPYPTTPPRAAATARERATKVVLRLKAAREESRKPHEPPALRVPTSEREARLLAEQAFQKGKAHLRANQLAAAAPELRRAFDLDPKAIEYELYARWATSRLREAGIEPRELDLLRGLARKAITVDPNLAFPYYVLGHVALIEGADVVARRCFQQALKIDPDAIDAERHIRILARRKHGPSSKQGVEVVAPAVVAAPAVAPPPPKRRATLWVGVGCLVLFTVVAFVAVAWKEPPSDALPPSPSPR
jgi:tetratricopeptide (TPR) repeat protein